MVRRGKDKSRDLEKEIVSLIKEHPRGLTIKEVSEMLNICRNTAAKYLSNLARSGEIEERNLGPSKLYCPSKRIQVKELLNFIKKYGIVMVDSNYRIININYTAAEIMGIQARERVIGEAIKSYDPFLKNPELGNAINKAVDGEDVMMRDFMDAESHDDPRYYNFIFLPCVYENGDKGAIVVMEDITDIKLREVERKKFLEERAILYDELRQRVKDNLQLIVSMINLQLKRETNEYTRNVLKKALARVKSIALIHERIYSEKTPLSINMEEYIQNLIKSLYLSYEKNPNRILFTVDSRNISIDLRKAIPCGIIITELVSNSLLHAFPNDKKGKIWVKLGKMGNICVLEIGDDGCGLPENVDIKNPETLGLNIVKTLVNQLNGTMSVKRDGGTVFKIEFDAGG